MKAPATFSEVVARGERELVGGERLIGLRAAVDVLFADLRPAQRRAAMAEVDEHTQRQPFRLESPAGPFFAEYTLWRFAGRPGRLHCDCDGIRKRCRCGARSRPAWPKSRRQVARRLAVAA